MKKHFILTIMLATLFGCQQKPTTPSIASLDSPTSSLLQAISIVDENNAWISGHDATFVRTNDGGDSWELFNHPTGDTLQFRDVHGLSGNKAILMTAGPGALSRIFTFEAPDQWEENFVMQDSLGFLDCIDFWDDQRGIAYGDAIDAYPYILLTTDGGQSWTRADSTSMPKAGKGEGGFAASGTCVTTGDNGKAWIATGAGGNCRVLITEDYGISWREVDSPIISGDAAGNTSVTMVGNAGFLTGGDLAQPNEYTDNCAFTSDGGSTWSLANRPQTKGSFYGGAFTKVDDKSFAFGCGPNGLDYSGDLGQSWTTLDTLNYWAVSIKGSKGYASGTEGKILRISLQP